MVVQVTPPGIANLGWKFWIIWACICFSFIPITYLFYPETANRTLEDIDRFFETKPGIIVAWNKSEHPFLSTKKKLCTDDFHSGNAIDQTGRVYSHGRGNYRAHSG
jgi:hypothetical protein